MSKEIRASVKDESHAAYRYVAAYRDIKVSDLYSLVLDEIATDLGPDGILKYVKGGCTVATVHDPDVEPRDRWFPKDDQTEEAEDAANE